MMPRPKPTQDAIVRRLRQARKAAGYTQDEAADLMGMHRPTVSMIESGKRHLMAMEAIRFCRFYKVSMNWLLGFSDEVGDLIENAAMYCERLPVEVREALHKIPELDKEHQCAMSSRLSDSFDTSARQKSVAEV